MTSDEDEPREGRREIDLHDLIALRDGQLSPAEEASVLERISSDPSAAELLEELDDTDAILARVRERTMPSDIAARIESALDRAAHERADSDPPRDPGDGDTPPPPPARPE